MQYLAIPLAAALIAAARADEPKPLTAAEAVKKVDEKVTVKMKVKTAKDRLKKRGEVYLDSEEDFRDPKNLGVVITRDGAKSLKKAGIDAPASHFEGKTILVKGTVTMKEDRPRIEIDDAKQIKVIEE